MSNPTEQRKELAAETPFDDLVKGTETEAATTEGPENPVAKTGEPDVLDEAVYAVGEYSDDDLALALGEAGLNDLAKYVEGFGNLWVSWNGQHWQIESKAWIMGKCRTYCRLRASDLRESANSMPPNTKEYRETMRVVVSLGSSAKHASVARTCRTNIGIAASPDDFDAKWWLLGTPNGVVNLETGLIREAQQDDMITKITACEIGDPLPQDAEWFQFLRWMTCGDEELLEFWHRSAGSFLCGKSTEEKLWFAFGTGGNGKNTLLDTIRAVMGEYAAQLSSAYLMRSNNAQHPTGLAKLRGARLVVASEIPRGAVWDEAMLKDLTGEDTFQARGMRQDMQDIKRTFDLVIAGNVKPRVKFVDPALQRRMQLIPFDAAIGDARDNDLKRRLFDNEGPGILRWMIEGSHKYLGLNGHASGLMLPDRVKDETDRYLESEDLIMQFVEDKLTLDREGWTSGGDLLSWHRTWSEQQGLSFNYSQAQLMNILEERLIGVRGVKRMGVRGLKGIAAAYPI